MEDRDFVERKRSKKATGGFGYSNADSMRLSAASTVALVFSAATGGHWVWRGWTAYERERMDKK